MKDNFERRLRLWIISILVRLMLFVIPEHIHIEAELHRACLKYLNIYRIAMKYKKQKDVGTK